MIVTIELSLYPLNDSFDVHILNFIKRLRTYPELAVYSNPISTYIKGDLSTVMSILAKELETIYSNIETSSTIIKIINRDLPIEDGYYKMKS